MSATDFSYTERVPDVTSRITTTICRWWPKVFKEHCADSLSGSFAGQLPNQHW